MSFTKPNIKQGGTGAGTAASARTNLGLGLTDTVSFGGFNLKQYDQENAYPVAEFFSTGGPGVGGGVSSSGLILQSQNDNVDSGASLSLSTQTKFLCQLESQLLADTSGQVALQLGDASAGANYVFRFSYNLLQFLVPFGYGEGVGSTVTQQTSKSTSVTINNPCGSITTSSAAILPLTSVSFTMNNSSISASDVVIVSIQSGATANSYELQVAATAIGSCVIQIRNTTGAVTLSDAIVINFSVIKSSVA